MSTLFKMKEKKLKTGNWCLWRWLLLSSNFSKCKWLFCTVIKLTNVVTTNHKMWIIVFSSYHQLLSALLHCWRVRKRNQNYRRLVENKMKWCFIYTRISVENTFALNHSLHCTFWIKLNLCSDNDTCRNGTVAGGSFCAK